MSAIMMMTMTELPIILVMIALVEAHGIGPAILQPTSITMVVRIPVKTTTMIMMESRTTMTVV